ncbi:glycosyltransferase [Flavobacteriales bacterium]|nr:glycosyltransferase [Flavobacteriales bacterium]
MNKLILFTSSFPFGNKETYLEREIEFLAKAFDKIEIYPHYYIHGNKKQREVPNNIKVHKPALPIRKYKRLFQSLKGVFKGAKLGLFINEFLSKKVITSKTNFKSWLITLISYTSTVGSNQYDVIKKEENAIFYFYWGFGWSHMLLNFNQAKSIISHIRVHGGEVYLERSNGYIPLSKQLFRKPDFLLPISKNLAAYLKTRYDILSEKIEVSRLGVFMANVLSEEKAIDSNEMHIVSCSNMIKLKRINMIVEALKYFDKTTVTWVHFGDGPEMNAIKEQISSAAFKSINIELVGRKTNAEVLDYYNNNRVDVFINVSKHEGIPVSAMEAMACKIPCIATNVGATAELVNNENGILLEEDFSVDKLVLSLQEVKKVDQWNKKREVAFAYCDKYFNAERNYAQLSQILKNKL